MGDSAAAPPAVGRRSPRTETTQPGLSVSNLAQPPATYIPHFVFATGIECSYPTVAGPQGRSVRVDELEKTFHYRHWREDLALVRELGLRYLRYGPPYYRVHTGPDGYDWEFVDQVFGEIRRLGIAPIVDLCHFGVPDWAGDFQNPDWPALFGRFAGAFARRFPWVQFYTPVNEIYVCAKLSALDGIWNERKRQDDRAFVTALKHLCRANLLAVREILSVRPDAVVIQSESAEYFHSGGNDPACRARTAFENQRRFLSFDLLYSVPPCADVALYLFDNGLTRDEYRWFMGHGLGERIVMGNDFYERNEQIVVPGGAIKPAGEVYGWAEITRQYFERYRRPVMHTETNFIASSIRSAAGAPRWLWKEFFNVRYLREQGVPVLGFTWYSLIDQVDWDSALVLDRGVVNPVGLYDLQRRPHPVAAAYQEMIRQFGGEPLVPASPVLAFYQGPAPAPPGAGSGVRGQGSGVKAFYEGAAPAPPGTAVHPGNGLPASGRPKAQHTVDGRPPLPERAVVAIARTTDERIDDDGVVRLVREALHHLGGLERFVKAGQTVLLKPNLTIFGLAKDGATTDPRVVAALARLAREAGAGTVRVGECSSCGQVTREIMATTGMERAARAAGAEPVYFDEVEQIEVDVPRGKLIRRIPVPRPLLEADVVIACPKLKTHFLDPVTGAIKLWVGAARQDTMHRLHRDRVEETVADLLSVTRPDLVVMDAIIAGEGVTMAGTLGHFKGFADLWQQIGAWRAVVATRGRPTFLIGRAEDPDFEQHLQEGPYLVLDDVALDKYKRDPRVTFIPGSPIGNEMMPVIMQALGVALPGQAAQKMLEAWAALQARWLYR